jgi:hypothetical protein
MLRTDVLTFQTVGFILRVKQNVLAGLAQREIEMGWYNLTNQHPTSNLIANRGRLCRASQRLHKSFSPPTSPGNRCSAPITGDPNWLAS